MEALSETTEGAISGVGIAALAVTLITSSSAIFISLIGFSEFLALVPIVNISYTPGLN